MMEFLKHIFKKQYKIQVNYKSGRQYTFWVSEFSWKTSGFELVSVKWETVNKNKRAYFMGAENIESIYLVKTRWVI